MSLADAIEDPVIARAVRELEAKVELLSGALMVGRGSPEGKVVARIGTQFVDRQFGSIYIKDTDDSLATGWILHV